MEFTMKIRKMSSKSKTSGQILDGSAAAATDATTTNPTGKLMKKRRKSAMGKCKKCVCESVRTSTVEFPLIWDELRTNNQLCDGTVKCDDGVEFSIHRAILSAASPYFKALFTNSINRGQPETTTANVNVSSEVFQHLLDFAYTGNCVINEYNVENLLKYADQYEILGVVQMCCKYLIDELCPSNCLGILQFAGQYFCKQLVEKCQLFIRHNFLKVLKESNEFLLLPVDELIDILKDDNLNIKTEETVFDAIKLWMNYQPEERRLYLLELMKCIRLGTIPWQSISRMVCWPEIEESEECNQFMSEILMLVKNLKPEEIDLASNYIFRPRIPYDVLFAVGGWSAGSPTNFVETYDIRADKWLLSMDTDSVPRAYHGLCAFQGIIYMIGGFDGNEYFNTVRCFDPLTHVWSECACMYYPRCYVSVVLHNSKIYAMGGYNGRIRMNSAERYDPKKNQWELIASMQRQRSDASAASLGDKIYIVGGFNGQEVMCSAEVFDSATNQWTYIPPMISARSGVSLIAFRNSLYALGGFNGYTRLTSGEKLTPDTSTNWTEISEMMTPRSNFATVILDEFIYVIGGFNDRFVSGSTTINHVEYFDTETNEWFDAASMNLNRSALSACVISGLPNAREFSFLGRYHRELGQGAGINA